MKFYSLVFTAFLLVSCTPQKSADNGSQAAISAVSSAKDLNLHGSGSSVRYALEITEKNPTRRSILNLTSTGFNLLDNRIEWLVNDRPFTTPAPSQFQGKDAVKGATIQARVVVGDQEVRSNIVQIVNCLPEIVQVKILPEVFKPGDSLYVEAAGSDVDDDPVTLQYEWTRNGEPAGNNAQIEGPIRRGDTISVKVTPFDGEGYGNPVLIQREIANFPPSIEDHKEFIFENSAYTYQVKAFDPDGDKLTYSLDAAPPEMSIDPGTGLIKWTVPQEFIGKKDVTVIVSDGNGGTASYSLTITIEQHAAN